MPFTVSPASYRGGDYLFQGITNAANSITGAINHFSDTADKAAQADALMQYLSQQQDPATGKPVVDQKALETYMHHSARQRAYVAGGLQAGMALTQALGHYTAATRKDLAETNYYTAHAEALRNPQASAAPAFNQVYNPATGKYENVFTHGKEAQLLPGQEGTPGTYAYDDKNQAYGRYNNLGKLEHFTKPGMDLNALFGGGGGGDTAAPAGTPAPAGTAAPTGPQPTDQAYSTQGDPGNLPPMYRQQPGGQPAAARAQAQAGQVHVLHPDGKTDGYIPASQLQAAIQAGYRQL